MKLTIEELANKVNQLLCKKLDSNLLRDGRQSTEISTRRIRDYITKGLLKNPIGNGREKWFGQDHVEELLALRLLQHNGLSDQYIINSTNTNKNEELFDNTKNRDDVIKNEAINYLKSIEKEQEIKETSTSFSNKKNTNMYFKSSNTEDKKRLNLLNEKKK